MQAWLFSEVFQIIKSLWGRFIFRDDETIAFYKRALQKLLSALTGISHAYII